MWGGHAMLAVGYNDTIGGFKVVNSWGQSWGQAGYGYLAYDFVQQDCWEAWLMVDHDASPPAPDPRTITIPLSEGWNLISLPVVPTSDSIGVLLAGVSDDVDVAFTWDAQSQTWQRHVPSAPLCASTLQTFDYTRGLWIKALRTTTLDVEGTPPIDRSVALRAGWNLVTYAGDSAVSVAEGLASIAGKYSAVRAFLPGATLGAWQAYDVGTPPQGNTLTQLEPKRGYWIRATTACTWIMP
jgi:hypothetical protein